MAAADPASFRRRLLLAVVGLTPQVVTETLYSLVVQRRPALRPTGIHLITTGEGAGIIERKLLARGDGALARFAADYAPDLSDVFAETRVDVLGRDGGRPFADIARAEEGLAAADSILQAVRTATADPDTAVLASLAGGRKTMSFLLGYALSLYGRPQDRLTHVLVNPPFQDHPDFYYPPPQGQSLVSAPDAPVVRTDDARIVLTDIPFVRLRDGLPQRLLEGTASYAETVEEAQQALMPAELVLDVGEGALFCAGRGIRLPPIEFAFLLWLARRRLAGEPFDGALSWREADAAEFLEVYAALPCVKAGHLQRVRQALRQGVSQDWFEQRVSRVNKLVELALGRLGSLCAVVARGRRPNTRYGLPDRLESITIREPERQGNQG